MRKIIQIAVFILALAAFAQLPATAAEASVKAERQNARKVDLNTATENELSALEGIGPVTAKKIIANRPYSNMADLTRAGLSAARVDQLKPHVTITHSTGTKTTVLRSGTSTSKDSEHGMVVGDDKVDINSASLTQLEALPGIGASTAQEIIRARPFRTINDLQKVKGIGVVRFDEIKNHVTVTRQTPSASKESSHKAKEARSNETVREPSGAARTGSSTRNRLESRVNLNVATQAELEALPGIGPVKARAIIENRPFNNKEDVMKVKGIKQGEFDKIKDQITVE